VIACAASLQFAGGVCVAVMLRRQRSSVAIVIAILMLVALIGASGIALRAAATELARHLQVGVVHVDPGAAAYLAPPLFALFAWVTGNYLLRGAWTSRPAVTFYTWLLVFTAANTINYCSPGWCTTLGFPLPWRNWSDAILGGFESLDRALEVVGGVVDLTAFVLVAWVATRRRPL
jgi:hypothetical protein